MAMKRPTWKEVRSEVLTRLDFLSEYKALGLVPLSSKPNRAGWVKCRAHGRQDKNPSGSISVKSGAYKDFAEDSKAIGFFDACVQLGNGKYQSWMDAVKDFAERLGITVPGGGCGGGAGGGKEKPRPTLAFIEATAQRARMYASRKPGITAEAFSLVEAQQAEWPGRAAPSKRFTVFVFPIYAPSINPEDPDSPLIVQGNVIINVTAAELQIYQGEDAPPTSAKSITMRGSSPGLLNGPALQALQPMRGDGTSPVEIVWKVEGVTDMLALVGAIPPELRSKHVVTTNPNGAGQEPTAEMLAFLRGKTVYVVHDQDQPGARGAEKWCAALAVVCSEVRNVHLPYQLEEKHGKDVRDFIAEGHAYQELLDLAAAAGVVQAAAGVVQGPTNPAAAATPSLNGQAHGHGHGHGHGGDHGHGGGEGAENEAADFSERLKLIRLEVLGHYENGDIEVFATDRRQAFTVKTLNFLSYAQMLQFCGASARHNISETTSADEHGGRQMLTMSQVRNAIGYASGYRRISAKRQIGAGIWRLNGDPSVVIVDAGRAAVWADGKLTPITVPRVGDFVLDFRSDDRSWCDLAALSGYLEQSADKEFCIAAFDEVVELLRQWHFSHACDAQTIAAILFTVWVQTLWPHRPHVAISGETNAGKSLLTENLLQGFFGNLALYTNRPTEAGIRQAVLHRSSVLLLDEFEDDHNRPRVLELLRTSTKGSTIIRGTQDQRGRSFGMRHIAFVAAIENGLTRGPDRNRFIPFEIKKPADRGKKPPPVIPPSATLSALGVRCAAVAIRCYDTALALFKKISIVQIPGVDGRMVENYSVPAAMHAAIHGHDEQQATETLKKMIGEKYSNTPSISDEKDLLRDILASQVVVGPSRTLSVAEIIRSNLQYRDHGPELERQGVSLVRTSGRGRKTFDASIENHDLFLAMRDVSRNLLKGTRWGVGMDLDALIKRVGEGTRTDRKMLGGRREHGIVIPLAIVQEYLDNENQPDDGEGDQGDEAELDAGSFEDS